MKKLSKLIVFLLILAMGIGFLPFNAFSSVYAAVELLQSTIAVEGFVSEGTIGSTIFVPKATMGSSSTTTIKVVNPNGVDVTSQELSANGSNFNLTPTTTGIYQVYYGVSSTNLTLGEIDFETNATRFQILVKGSKPTMSFEDNLQHIIPTTIGDKTAITLPYPTVIGTDGNEVSLDNVIANTTITITKPAEVTGDINRTTVTIDGKSYVKFTTIEDKNGIYTITYKYVDPSISSLYVEKKFEVLVETNFVAPTEFTTSRSASVPTSLELGKTTTLPTYTLKDNKGNVLQSFTKIEAKFIPASSTGTDHIDCSSELNGYEFTPTHEAKNGAVYQITYKIYDFANLSGDPVVTKTHTITSVKDTISPTPYPVADYDAIEDAVLNAKDYYLDNASYLIPSKVAKGESRSIPAIFARDAYNVTLPTNLTLTRTIITPENVQDTTFVDNDATKAIAYTFNMEGTYTIKYTATDSSKNINTSVSYDVVVEEGFVDAVAPRITFSSTIPSYAKKDSLVKFLKPSAVDYLTTSSTETTINDKNVKIETYYYTDDVNSKTKIEEYEIDKSYLAFNVPTTMAGNTLTIFVKATDDYNNVSTKTVVINIANTTNDTILPTLKTTLTLEKYNQDETVNLPVLEFTDNNIQSAKLSIDIIDANGNFVSVFGLNPTLINDNGTIKLQAKNAKFIPAVAGEYKAIYTITDIGGNSLITAYNLEIIDNIKPIVSGPSVWSSEGEVGVPTFLPSSIVTDNGVEITNESLTKIEITSQNHSSDFNLDNTTLEFVSYVAGTYEFVYIGEDAAGNTEKSKPYTLTIKDSYAPEITILSGLEATYDLTITSGEGINPVTYADITIPGFEATDVHYNDDKQISSSNVVVERYVRVKDADQKFLTIKIGGVEQSTKVSDYSATYSFTPTKAGTYTVVYYAKDSAGKETKIEKTIKIGDHVAPVVTIAETETTKFDAKFTVGDKLSLDMSKITANDDKDGNISFDTIQSGTNAVKLVSVKVTNPSGTQIYRIATSDNSLSTDATPVYNLETSGDYTVTYTVKDNTGNIATKTFNFTVDAKEEKEVIATEVWGIILIIVAVAILAGIVIYFIKTRKIKNKPTAIIRK